MVKSVIKQQLLEQCNQIIQEKIEVLEKMMDDAQQSANNETKSSAGDKYETGRAMMQLEKEKHGGQLAEAIQLRNKLKLIKANQLSDQVVVGSVVETKLANYFIAISAGRIEVAGQKFFVISPQAPLAIELLRKQAGDIFTFNDQEMKILDVY